MADVTQTAISLANFVVVSTEYYVAPKFYMNKENVDVTMDHRVEFTNDSEGLFSIVYTIKIDNAEGLFKLHANAIALFTTDQPIDEAFKASPLPHINAVAIGFPFLRSFIASFTINAGFPRILLPSVNFYKASKMAANKAAAEGEDIKEDTP